MIDSYIDFLIVLLIFVLINLLYVCGQGITECKRLSIEYLQATMRKKELQKRKELLEARTNPEIANLILSFL